MAAAIIGGIIALIGTVVSVAVTAGTALGEQDKAEQLNEKNREYELEDREYLAEREDTAVQRRAEDLQKAGINPMLAGLGGASSARPATRNTSSVTPPIAGIIGDMISSGMNGVAGTVNQVGMKQLDYTLDEEERLARIDKLRSETEGIDEETRKKAYENAKNRIELETYKEQKLAELQNTKITNEHLEQAKKESIARVEASLNQEQREKLRLEMEKATKEIEDEIKKEELKYKQHENEMTEIEKQQEEARLEALKQNKVVQIIDTGIRLVDEINDIKNTWYKPWTWGKKDNNKNNTRRKKGK